MARNLRVTGSTVRVDGLAQLIRDFDAVSKELSRDLRRELLDVARMVSDHARTNVVFKESLGAGQGGQDRRPNTGRLQRGIRPKMRGATAIVESRTKSRGGYPYPGIYEFGVSGRARARRAFLEPALDQKSDDVVRSIEDMFDRLTSEHGLGRGGLL